MFLTAGAHTHKNVTAGAIKKRHAMCARATDEPTDVGWRVRATRAWVGWLAVRAWEKRRATGVCRGRTKEQHPSAAYLYHWPFALILINTNACAIESI